MKIVNNARIQTVAFKSLSYGDLFIFDNGFYMKIDICVRDTRFNTVDLKTGEVKIINVNTDVVPVEGELVINNKEDRNV